MNNTKPEVRVNKLGVPVTKHVRVDPKVQSATAKLPAPAPRPAAPERLESPAQLQPKKRFLSSLKYEPARELQSLRPYGGFEFEASDAEMFAVMSVADDPNAFAMLNRDIRTAEQAENYLRSVGAEHLFKDRSALMNDLLQRGISPVDAADMLSLDKLQLNTVPDRMEDSPYCADAIEFHSRSELEGKDGRRLIRNSILNGKIWLDDLYEVGVERLERGNNQLFAAECLIQYTEGTTNYSPRELGLFFDKIENETSEISGRSRYDDNQVRTAIKLLDRIGWDKVNEMSSVLSFIMRYRRPEEPGNEQSAVDAAYYETILSIGMESTAGPLGGRTGMYWAKEFPGEAKILREAGVSAQDAIPIMAQGKTAHETLGILNGVEAVVADGWL